LEAFEFRAIIAVKEMVLNELLTVGTFAKARERMRFGILTYFEVFC
jgi:hypothetical protein